MKDLTHGPRPGFWWMLWRLGGLLPLVLAVMTVGVSLGSFGQLKSGLEFEADGVEVTADVVDRSTRQVRSGDRTKTEYRIDVLYMVNGTPVRVPRKVSRALYEASEIGSSRTVRYLPRRPMLVEIVPGETLADGRVARWVALGFGLLTLAVLWWKGAQAVDAIRARKFGTVERVSVVKIIKLKGKNTTRYQLQWFDDNKQFGTSLSSGNRARFDPYPLYSTVEVFRGAKGQAWWVGDVGPRDVAPTVPSVGKS